VNDGREEFSEYDALWTELGTLHKKSNSDLGFIYSGYSDV